MTFPPGKSAILPVLQKVCLDFGITHSYFLKQTNKLLIAWRKICWKKSAEEGKKTVIVNFGNSATEKFAMEGRSKFSGLDEGMADQRIAELNAAKKLSDLAVLSSVGLHKLKGPLKHFWSIDINGPWRLVFKFNDGNAHEVEIKDTH